MSNKKINRRDYIFGIYFILLFAFPRMNIYIASFPLYFIDVISVYMIVRYGKSSFYKISKIKTIGFFLILFFLIQQIFYVIALGEILNVIYMTFRYTLPFIGMFTFYGHIYNALIEKESKYLINSLVLAISFTSIFILLNTLPFTRNFIADVFSHSFFYPSAEKSLSRTLDLETATRGYSLIGVPNITGIVILSGLGLYINYKKQSTSIFSILIVIVSLVGTVVSYSRTVLLVLVCFFLIVIFFLKVKKSVKLFTLSFMVLFIFSWESLVSNTTLFNFSRINETVFNPDVNDDNYKHGIEERTGSYIQPFADLYENQSYILIGNTINSIKSKKRFYFFEEGNKPDHSLFGRSFYIYGLIFTILLSIVFYRILKFTIIDLLKGNLGFLIFLPVLIWCLTAHGMISTSHGSMLFLICYTFVEANNAKKKIS